MRWTLKPKQDSQKLKGLGETLKVDDIVATLLLQRGIETYEEAKTFFRPSLDDLHDPFLMKDMDIAVERIELALSKKENIVSLLLVIAVIIFIAFLFPSAGQFNLDYKNGEVWKHDDLLAPFEYPLLKSPEEISRLRNKVKNEFIPYFKSTRKRGKVSGEILDFLALNKEAIGEEAALRIQNYVDSNKNKILIAKEQLSLKAITKK